MICNNITESVMVSILVPVYNVSRFLPECIKGVLAQSFIDWELILVNDGSTDDSGAICDTFAATDSRIKVIHKPNSGVSDSRNRALDMAAGKYILFLDADDFWCSVTFLEKMLQLAEEENLDIVRGEYKEVTESGADYRNPSWPDKQQLECHWLSSSVFLEKVIAGEYFSCLCLIRMEKVASIRFDAHRTYLEDAIFLLQLTQQELKCVYFPIVFYAYRKYGGATTERIGPRQWKEAFTFMDATFHLSLKAKDQNMKRVLLKESCIYFFPYLKTISQSSYPFCQQKEWGQEWGIANQKGRVCSYMRSRRQWINWAMCSLPLNWLILSFRCFFLTKNFVKQILRR